MHKVARKNRKIIIITALASVAVLLLLASTYRLACGIGLKKVYSDNGITIYADGSIQRKLNKWQKRFDRSCWRLIAIILQEFLSIFAGQ